MRADGITRTTPEIVSYGISADEAHRFGLPCGGTIELAIEPLSERSRIAELLGRLARHELVARRLDLCTGAVALGTAAPGINLQRSESALTAIHGPRWRLLIIGGRAAVRLPGPNCSRHGLASHGLRSAPA